MSPPVVFRPAAAADAEEAFRWYEERRPGLGEEFLSEVSRTIRAIIESPERYPVMHRRTRRALVSRFPYGIFYQVLRDQIVIIACFHAKRNPTVWRSRR